MLVDKQAIISELESRGEKELVEQAQAKLPDQVHLGGPYPLNGSNVP
jgi:hypothetical protein